MKTRDALISLLILPILIAGLLAAPAIVRTVRPIAQFPTPQEAVDHALAWLHTQQESSGDRDGAIGTSSVSCDVARVVALAGEDPDGPAWTPGSISLLQRCQMDLPEIFIRDDAGITAKVLRAAVATGNDPRDFGGYDLIARVEAAYDPTTGLYHPKSVFRDTLAVLALQEAGRPVPDAAIQALIDQRNRLQEGEDYALPGADFVGVTAVTIAGVDSLEGMIVDPDNPDSRTTIAFALADPVYISPRIVVEELRNGVWVETFRMELVEYGYDGAGG
jgi:hypothetical protein